MAYQGVITVLAVVAALFDAAPAVVRTAPREILRQTVNLRPEVLTLAVEAYERAVVDRRLRRPVLTIIDYELPSYEKRLWVIDMTTGRILHHELVAHGMGNPPGSGGTMEKALSFSNEKDSRKSSLGLFVTAETYLGRHGYSLKLDGLDEGLNDNARERLIVLHGAEYVSLSRAKKRRVGRSWGCPVVRPEIARPLIDAIKDGSVLWVYSPDSVLSDTSDR